MLAIKCSTEYTRKKHFVSAELVGWL